MLNWLWGFMIIIGIVYALITGNIESVTQGAFDSAKEAVTLCITMFGIMAFWCGLMEIAEKSGLIDRCKYRIEPLIKWLFPGVPSSSKAFGYIVTNMISNFLGLGWAATPAGIKAMKEMAVLNENKNIASCDMCTFLVINISSIQLIPAIKSRNPEALNTPTATISPISVGAIETTVLIPSSAPFTKLS